jgi:hypothetical protein
MSSEVFQFPRRFKHRIMQVSGWSLSSLFRMSATAELGSEERILTPERPPFGNSQNFFLRNRNRLTVFPEVVKPSHEVWSVIIVRELYFCQHDKQKYTPCVSLKGKRNYKQVWVCWSCSAPECWHD